MQWALLRSTWTPAVRIPLKWDLISRSATQSNARSKSSSLLASSRLQYPRFPPDHWVFEDLSKEYATASSNSPPSEQTLVNLVKEGKHDLANKVRQELSELGVNIQPSSVYEVVVEDMLQNQNPWSTSALQDWLTVLPDAEEPGTNAFIKIRKLLLASPKENLLFIKQFCRICASKGYTYILENDILPIISLHVSPEAHAAFVNELQVEAKAYQGEAAGLSQPYQPHTGEVSAVFEDTPDEYDIVNSGSTPHPPPILSLIEDTLPKLLPPPPSHDQLVFEDSSNLEYTLCSTSLPSYKPNSLNDSLRSLVESKQYDEAFRILNEIKELNMHIPTNWVYLRAARAVLRSSVLSSQEQINAFASWFSLIPPMHHTPSVTFVRMNELIFASPNVNGALVIRFALILASKGFARIVIQEQTVIRFIIHYFPFDVYHQFILDFEKANREYWMAHRPELAYAKNRRMIAITRGAVVKCLVDFNRLEEAIGLLPDIRNNRFPLLTLTYNILLCHLHIPRNQALKHYVPMIEALRGCPPTVLEGHVADEHTSVGVDIASTVGTQPAARATVHTNSFERLKLAVASKRKFPHHDTLVDFMETCFNNGEAEPFLELRNLALSSCLSNASTFLFAEMLYYKRQKLDNFVIQTFVNHFLLGGVPKEEVLAQYDQAQQIQPWANNYGDGNESIFLALFKRNSSGGATWPSHAQAGDPADGNKPPSRFVSFKPNPFARKLGPGKRHCSLVWHSLVRTAPNTTAIERLYAKLVQLGLHRTYSAEIPTAIDNPSLIPPHWEHGVHESYFTPFIRPLMKAFGAARGPMVLVDMLKIGLEPSVYHYTEMAGQYARTGDELRAFQVLGRMEVMVERYEMPLPGTDLPSPDVIMYISLITGFTLSKNVKAAEEVVRRFQKRYTYVPGQNRKLDDTFHTLQRLREDQANAMFSDSVTVNSTLRRFPSP